MNDDEVRVTSESGGEKGRKDSELAFVDPWALLQLGRVAGAGAKKYAAHNYRKGYPVSLSFNAALRHLLTAINGEDVDEETQAYHLAQAAWQCLAALTILHDHPEFDDRHHNHDKGLSVPGEACERMATSEEIAAIAKAGAEFNQSTYKGQVFNVRIPDIEGKDIRPACFLPHEDD